MYSRRPYTDNQPYRLSTPKLGPESAFHSSQSLNPEPYITEGKAAVHLDIALLLLSKRQWHNGFSPLLKENPALRQFVQAQMLLQASGLFGLVVTRNPLIPKP